MPLLEKLFKFKPMIYPWGSERRINTYSEYFKREFGSRVQKISIDAGFSCPNRDGLNGSGGCTFCNNKAFTPSYTQPENSISDQVERGMEFHRGRYRKASSYLAYFQSYSNTYAELDRLKELYQEALDIPGIIGLVVGTRPDCVDEQKLDYFQELSKKYYVTLEYGIESVYDRTLERVNRGHDVEQTAWAIRETAARGIRVGGHMIVGLPGESREDMLDAIDLLSGWPLDNIKFHQLQLIHGTAMSREYKEKPEDFLEYTLEEYMVLMMEMLQKLNPEFVVERVAGEISPTLALREGWGIRYDVFLKRFEALLEEHDTWQGKYYKEEAE